VPLYEFVCRKCSHEFEELVSSRSPVPPCPRCQASTVDRIMSVTSVGRGNRDAVAASQTPCGTCGDPRGPGVCSMS